MRDLFFDPYVAYIEVRLCKEWKTICQRRHFFLKTLFLAGQGRSEEGRQDPTPPDTHVGDQTSGKKLINAEGGTLLYEQLGLN